MASENSEEDDCVEWKGMLELEVRDSRGPARADFRIM